MNFFFNIIDISKQYILNLEYFQTKTLNLPLYIFINISYHY